jgi:hypothetical protein
MPSDGRGISDYPHLNPVFFFFPVWSELVYEC